MGFSPVGFPIGVMIKGDNLMHEHLQAWSAIDTAKKIPWTLTGITAPSPITDKISFRLDLDFAFLTM